MQQDNGRSATILFGVMTSCRHDAMQLLARLARIAVMQILFTFLSTSAIMSPLLLLSLYLI
jgi:hypothetical protein